jgi:hypothetical protein
MCLGSIEVLLFRIRSSAMNASTDVPLTITPEAAARIAELGIQKEFEQMLEHARRVVADLAAIDVEIAEPYDTGAEPGINIWAYSDRPFVPADTTSQDLGKWRVRTFPPQVCEHMRVLLTYGRPHAR